MSNFIWRWLIPSMCIAALLAVVLGVNAAYGEWAYGDWTCAFKECRVLK